MCRWTTSNKLELVLLCIVHVSATAFLSTISGHFTPQRQKNWSITHYANYPPPLIRMVTTTMELFLSGSKAGILYVKNLSFLDPPLLRREGSYKLNSLGFTATPSYSKHEIRFF